MDDRGAGGAHRGAAVLVDLIRDRRTDYEAPTLVVIGPLKKITLGSGGTMNDGVNKLKKS
jgi:hypothetical protein